MQTASLRRKAIVAAETLKGIARGKNKGERRFYSLLFRSQLAHNLLERLPRARKILEKEKKVRMNGIHIYMRPRSRKDVSVFGEIFIKKEYSFGGKFESLLSETSKNNQGFTVLDVGAHIGLWSIWAKPLFHGNTNFICFEPNHDNYLLLVKNLKLHGINADARQTAVSINDGETNFFIPNGLSTQGALESYGIKAKSVLVKSATLDSVSKEIDPKKNLVVKIDIEGGETEAFEKGKKLIENAKIIVGEYHFPKTRDATANWENFKKFLEEHKFKLITRESNTEGDIYFKKLIMFMAYK